MHLFLSHYRGDKQALLNISHLTVLIRTYIRKPEETLVGKYSFIFT